MVTIPANATPETTVMKTSATITTPKSQKAKKKTAATTDVKTHLFMNKTKLGVCQLLYSMSEIGDWISK